MDVLHPLSKFECKRICNEDDDIGSMIPTECVLLGNTLFVGITRSEVNTDLYYKQLNDSRSLWSMVRRADLPPQPCFALTTYLSQLVIVGGRVYEKNVWPPESTNKVWASEDGRNWRESVIPPMLKKRCFATAVNVSNGSQEFLVVIGGIGVNNKLKASVEVFANGHWCKVKSLPRKCCRLKHTIHNGTLFLVGSPYGNSVVYCDVSSLLAAAGSKGLSKKVTKSEPLWTQNWFDGKHNSTICRDVTEWGLASYRHTLLLIGTTQLPVVLAFSPVSLSWVFVGNIYVYDSEGLVPVMYHDEKESCLAVVKLGKSYRGGWGFRGRDFTLSRVHSKVSQYNLDDRFDIRALTKLEAVGVQVLTSIENNLQVFAEACEIQLPETPTAISVLMKWIDKRNKLAIRNPHTATPPSWRALFRILCNCGMEELSQQMDEYLINISGVKSLKECCTSVVMSALLEQKSLEPEQLLLGFPDYVPANLRHSITDSFKAHTFHLPFGLSSPDPSSEREEGLVKKVKSLLKHK